jgi:hypothetical protein
MISTLFAVILHKLRMKLPNKGVWLVPSAQCLVLSEGFSEIENIL